MTSRKETAEFIREGGKIIAIIAHDEDRKNIVYLPSAAGQEEIATLITGSKPKLQISKEE